MNMIEFDQEYLREVRKSTSNILYVILASKSNLLVSSSFILVNRPKWEGWVSSKYNTVQENVEYFLPKLIKKSSFRSVKQWHISQTFGSKNTSKFS